MSLLIRLSVCITFICLVDQNTINAEPATNPQDAVVFIELSITHQSSAEEGKCGKTAEDAAEHDADEHSTARYASGFFINQNGTILTSKHLFKGISSEA